MKKLIMTEMKYAMYVDVHIFTQKVGFLSYDYKWYKSKDLKTHHIHLNFPSSITLT